MRLNFRNSIYLQSKRGIKNNHENSSNIQILDITEYAVFTAYSFLVDKTCI